MSIMNELYEGPITEGKAPKSLNDYLDTYLLNISKSVDYVKTGFDLLDNQIEGIRGLTVFGGAPGSGKTSLALQIGFQAAETQKRPVFVYSFEMPKDAIITRIRQQVTGINNRELERAAQNNTKQAGEGLERIKKVADRVYIKDIRDFFIEGKIQPFSFSEMETDIIEAAARAGKSPLIIIDSLHEIPAGSEYKELKSKIDFLMLNLRKVTDSTGATIIAMAHQNRESMKNGGGLSSFMGSAGIEYTVDMAFTIEIDKESNNREFKTVKNRYGMMGSVILDFDGNSVSFQ